MAPCMRLMCICVTQSHMYEGASLRSSLPFFASSYRSPGDDMPVPGALLGPRDAETFTFTPKPPYNLRRWRAAFRGATSAFSLQVAYDARGAQWVEEREPWR